MWKGCSGISKNQFSDFRSMYLENYVEVSEYELTFLLNNIQCPRKLWDSLFSFWTIVYMAIKFCFSGVQFELFYYY